MQPIYTQTVGAGGVTVINFNNIPQTFTDLKLVLSIRASSSSGTTEVGMYVNGTSFPAPSSYTNIQGNGSTATSGRNSGFLSLGIVNDTSSTANTFSSHDIYIPNYTSTNFKQFIVDSVTENNATAAIQRLTADLNRQSAAITYFSTDMGGNTFLQHSTATLYGITKG